MLHILYIGIGASIGAILRYLLSLLNPLFFLPLGTLFANLMSGVIGGVCMGYVANIGMSVEIRLLVITGFLGGLSTFSTFSMEGLTFLQNSQYWLFILHFLLHTIGTLLAVLCGLWFYRIL